MNIYGRWLGLLIGRGQLEPGYIFMSRHDPFLALRISPAIVPQHGGRDTYRPRANRRSALRILERKV